MTKKLVLFGAGNIGRSFIGQLFSLGGYEIVFVDIDPVLIRALNEENRYAVVVKENDKDDESIPVEHVRAVDGREINNVAREIETATLLATAVGKGALKAVVPGIAAGIDRRYSSGLPPIDIILAENVRGVASWIQAELKANLGVKTRSPGSNPPSPGRVVRNAEKAGPLKSTPENR